MHDIGDIRLLKLCNNSVEAATKYSAHLDFHSAGPVKQGGGGIKENVSTVYCLVPFYMCKNEKVDNSTQGGRFGCVCCFDPPRH